MANKPAHEIRDGLIKATIWRNEGEKGVFYNTTLERRYKKGDDWKSSGSFSRDQLLVVSCLSQQANAWINEQSKLDKKNEKADPADSKQDVA